MNNKKEKLLVLLDELRLESKNAEMFCWFLNNSSKGENCGYAKKALDTFYKKHFDNVKSLVNQINNLCNEINNV